jgi:anti-anti-sigma factor
MDVQATEVDGITKVVLSGRLDTSGASMIDLRFTAMVAGPGQPTVVDLTGVSFLASLGVRLLISTARALSRKGAAIAMFGASEAVLEIIETTALDQIIPVVPSEADAIALVRA